jgi:hypothetical protein
MELFEETVENANLKENDRFLDLQLKIFTA